MLNNKVCNLRILKFKVLEYEEFQLMLKSRYMIEKLLGAVVDKLEC